jgi:glycosyltransferase involved in cell wall biosynthesis
VPEKALQLHNPKEGFLVKGRAESARQVIRNARVLLAPLRYGAGLKGKFIDAMQCGTPSVTTTIGAEGMSQHLDWPGNVNDDYDAFIKAAVSLYSNESIWQKAQENGVRMINTNFQKDTYASLLTDTLQHLMDNLIMHRAANFTGQMLQHHTMRSTLFMSKWIAEKNKKE